MPAHLPHYALLAAAILTFSTPTQAGKTYIGRWEYTFQPQEPETLTLGDAKTQSALFLRSAAPNRICGAAGATPADIRALLNNTNGRVAWWIDHACLDGYARICLFNQRRQHACATYQYIRWGPFSP